MDQDGMGIHTVSPKKSTETNPSPYEKLGGQLKCQSATYWFWIFTCSAMYSTAAFSAKDLMLLSSTASSANVVVVAKVQNLSF